MPPHYARILATVVLLAAAAGGAVWRFWKPKPEPLYEERVMLDAAMRARLHGYLIEIWWILGYRSATGYFPRAEPPEGWGERLPPGWAAPDRPRLLTGR